MPPLQARRSAASLLLAGLAILASACSDDRAPGRTPGATTAAPASSARPPRLVVLGLDAGTWDLLDPWMQRGLLPNLARLRDNGAHGPLRSTQPSSSPVIWTSIATGKTPEKHGITWFVRFPNGPGKPVPVDRRMRRSSALWNMLGAEGFDVAVVGWFVTWPAEAVNGRLVTDIAHYGKVEQESFPPGYLTTMEPVPESDAVAALPRFMDFAYDPSKAARVEGQPPSLDFLVFDRFLRAWSRDAFYMKAAETALGDGPLPDALFLYLRGTDDVQHGFWKFMDPSPFGSVPADQVAGLGKVIERYWQWVDAAVGRILARYGDDRPLVLAVSDHGAGPAVGEDRVEVPEYMHLSGSHRIDGFFIASGPGVKPGAKVEGAGIYDVAPTILHALGLPVAEDMDGRVLVDILDGAAASRPVAKIPSYDAAAPAGASDQGGTLPADVDAKVLEHLRSLGYIE